MESSRIKCLFFLGDVTRKSFIGKVFEENKLILFFAAAYKHVLCRNKSTAEYLNVFRLCEICKASESNGVKQITYIYRQSCKTNYQWEPLRGLVNYSSICKTNFTTYSMVRFPILGSSGSVVPTFQTQINAGGSATVTHPDVLRYFMTISEAVQLVIQSVEFALGSFSLDMGAPIRVLEN